MAKTPAPLRDIFLCQCHGARQIALPLHGIGVQIADHIIRRPRAQGIRRIRFRFGIAMRFEQGKDTFLEFLDIHTHTIVILRRGL